MDMSQKSLFFKLLYFARDLRAKKLFVALRRYCQGDVLDVGGWDFYLTVKRKGLNFNTWTTLECAEEKKLDITDERYKFVHGDGCNMQFKEDSFDTVLNIQVLEHVFEPVRMVEEISRVLRPGGYAIFLIPQTGTIHLAPYHYYNFTRFWIEKAMRQAKLEILELEPLGGVWSTLASRLFYFFLQSARIEGMSTKKAERNVWFYLLFPIMVLYAFVSIPLCLFLSLGDLKEEPNNHLVVVRKPEG